MKAPIIAFTFASLLAACTTTHDTNKFETPPATTQDLVETLGARNEHINCDAIGNGSETYNNATCFQGKQSDKKPVWNEKSEKWELGNSKKLSWNSTDKKWQMKDKEPFED